MIPNRFLLSPVPLRQLYEGLVVPQVNDTESFHCFPDRWKHMAVDHVVPETNHDILPHGNYCREIRSE